jgi:hypothetical protein
LQIGAPQSRRQLCSPARAAARVLNRAHHSLPGAYVSITLTRSPLRGITPFAPSASPATREAEGRDGKGEYGHARTREVNLAVFRLVARRDGLDDGHTDGIAAAARS